jgi:peroxin-7
LCCRYKTQDSLYDLTHSESHSSHLLAASGDGSLRLYDTSLEPEFPIATFTEHAREAFACSWNLVSKTSFASSSWDGTVKIWNPERERSMLTMPTHSCTYSVQWSPHEEGVLSAVSSDSQLRLWDLRAPGSASNHLQLCVPIHAPPLISSGAGKPQPQPSFPPSEALTHDWNKYRSTVVAVAGVDRIIRTFDIRNPSGPVQLLQGHEYAVRKVAWSPHAADLLLSASYDMTVRVWSDGGAEGKMGPMPRELGRMGRHTEFVMGVDWCLFGAEGWAASCGWDERVCVFDAKAMMQ